MNAITWFEIPVADMDRAAKFYGSLVDKELERAQFLDVPHAIFGSAAQGVGGALVLDPRNRPSATGQLVYLAVDDIEAAISRVRPMGAEVLLPLTDIGDPGFIAILRDSEGNRVGIHTPRR